MEDVLIAVDGVGVGVGKSYFGGMGRAVVEEATAL